MQREVGKHMMYEIEERVFSCLHCNQQRSINMPMSLADFGDELRSFIKFHNSCEKRGEQ